MNELTTLLGDVQIGTLRIGRNGRMSFVYDDDWRLRAGAYPLSLSMPLAVREHGHAVVDAYLWGLLPDNEQVLERWAKQFQVSARNAFALLSHVGTECAGAVRFAKPDGIAALERDGAGSVQWLTEHDIGERLRLLRRDGTAWRDPNDNGQFSLAGAQPKTAFLFDGKRWGIPSGRLATTHILKPGAPQLDGHAENEHFCMALAGELGLPVANSHVANFDGEIAIVIERYDRVRVGKQVFRVHQEDTCQALGIHPSKKYENDNGPGAIETVQLIRDHSSEPIEDVKTFVGALAFNWLIAGTDAHAKNYSLLIGEGGRIRLAPLYDIASALPYYDPELRKIKLAMKIGGKYRVREVGPHEWQKLTLQLNLEPDEVNAAVLRMAKAMPDLAASLRRRLQKQRLNHVVLDQLTERIAGRARKCAASF